MLFELVFPYYMNLVKLKTLEFWNNYKKEKSLKSAIHKSRMILNSHFVPHEDIIGSYWVRSQTNVLK